MSVLNITTEDSREITVVFTCYHIKRPYIQGQHEKCFYFSLNRGSGSSYGSRKKAVEDIADMIKTRQVRNIIVMAGAGISTASGIPDFR